MEGVVEGEQREKSRNLRMERSNSVTLTVRVRSPPVTCELVQKFSRQKGVFDVALDNKTVPAP